MCRRLLNVADVCKGADTDTKTHTHTDTDTNFGTDTACLLRSQVLVEPAAPGSLPVRTWAWLCSGPLKGAMLSFYATSTDFSRRLVSFKVDSCSAQCTMHLGTMMRSCILD